MTTARRAALIGVAAAGLVALGTVSASAHVTITPSTTAAGATAVLRVEIPHGCEESATTGLTVRMPDGVTDVTATGTDRWAAEQAGDSVTWTTDEPLPDGEHAEVELSVRLPDDAGATLVFPVVQRCEVGEAAWTEVAEHAEEHDELERPAPVVVVTAGEGAAAPDADVADAAGTAHADHPADPADAEAAGATTGTGARDPLVTYGAAGLLAAGVLVGGTALLRRRRRQP